jgi:hypothetical protein
MMFILTKMVIRIIIDLIKVISVIKVIKFKAKL